MTKKTYFKFAIIFLIVSSCLSSLFQKTSGASYSGTGTNQVSGTLEATLSNSWEDSQWQYFTTTCDLNEHIIIELDYFGTLDIDLWVYVDEINTGSNQENFGQDISHCQLTITPTVYSSSKTDSTLSSSPERVEYINFDFITTRTVYILVFSPEGIGETSYNLTASGFIEDGTEIISENLKVIEPVPPSQLTQCPVVMQYWIVFIIASVLIFVLVVYIAKKAGRTREQKIADRQKKEEKKQAKLEKQGKSAKSKSSGMANRKGSRR